MRNAKQNPPKPLPKREVRELIGNFENCYSDRTKTLSRFFNKLVTATYDLSKLSPSEVLLIIEKVNKQNNAALILLHLESS